MDVFAKRGPYSYQTLCVATAQILEGMGRAEANANEFQGWLLELQRLAGEVRDWPDEVVGADCQQIADGLTAMVDAARLAVKAERGHSHGVKKLLGVGKNLLASARGQPGESEGGDLRGGGAE